MASRTWLLPLSAMLLGAVHAVSCAEERGPAALTFEGSDSRLAIEIADSEQELVRGLSGHESLGTDQGMLLVFPTSIEPALWMRDTQIPLSAAFLGRDGTILEVVALQPGSLEVHHAPPGGRYALEVNAGWFERNGLGPGDRVELGGLVDREGS